MDSQAYFPGRLHSGAVGSHSGHGAGATACHRHRNFAAALCRNTQGMAAALPRPPNRQKRSTMNVSAACGSFTSPRRKQVPFRRLEQLPNSVHEKPAGAALDAQLHAGRGRAAARNRLPAATFQVGTGRIADDRFVACGIWVRADAKCARMQALCWADLHLAGLLWIACKVITCAFSIFRDFAMTTADR